MTSRAFFAAVASFGSIAACTAATPPAMAPIDALPPPAGGDALVVFVRPASSCDTGDYAVVADDQGAFVGNLVSRSQFAIAVPPGEHVYYAWPSLDVRTQKYPGYDPVGAIRVVATPGAVHYVPVVVPELAKLHCNRYAVFRLGGPVAPGELEAWVRDARPLRSDRAAGQRLLDAEPEIVSAHVRAGRSALVARSER